MLDKASRVVARVVMPALIRVKGERASGDARPARKQSIMTLTLLIRTAAILTGSAFSLFYVALYRVLVGGFVIYRYPYWPPPLAMAYVLGGILLQAWLCLRPGRPSGSRLLGQIGAGFLYLAALALLPGSIYMS